jgi:parvulin-like peptidyl-prolyl isomerase
LAATLVFSGCRERDPAALGPDVVALVNGESLGREELSRELARELVSSELRDRTQEQIEPVKRALVDSLIERMLLLQQARKLEISAAEDEVERRLLRMAADFPERGFDDALGRGLLTRAELKRHTRDLVTIEHLFAKHLHPRVAVTEAELRDAFTARAAEFETAEQTRMLQIVVRELDEARRIQAQLRSGGDFAELARRFSLSADAKVGGDLGFFPKGIMPPIFDTWAWRLRPGQVSEVVESEYGFHLFKVVERRPAKRLEFEEAREALEKRLLAERRAEAERAWVAELKKQAQVRVNEAALQLVHGRSGDARADGTE